MIMFAETGNMKLCYITYSKMIKFPMILEMLSKEEYGVAAVGILPIFPAKPVNGMVIISGFTTLGPEKSYICHLD